MSRIKNSDCVICHEWIAQCTCDESYPYDNGEQIDAAQDKVNAMLEECSDYFASLQA